MAYSKEAETEVGGGGMWHADIKGVFRRCRSMYTRRFVLLDPGEDVLIRGRVPRRKGGEGDRMIRQE